MQSYTTFDNSGALQFQRLQFRVDSSYNRLRRLQKSQNASPSSSKASCSYEHLLILLHSPELTHRYGGKMLEALEKIGTAMH